VSEPADSPAARPARSRRARARRVGVVLLVLAGLAIAALYWLVASRGGARFTVDRLSQLLPGRLTVERVEGPVRGPLILHGVRYETERFILTIDWARLDWRLGQLRRRILDVEQLDARGVVVRILPSDEVRERELRDINLRYNVVVRALRVDDVEIFRPEQELPVVIDRLTMRTGAWRDAVRIEEIDVVSPHFDLDAEGWLRPTGDYPLDVTIAWAYRPPEDAERNLPGFAGRGTLGGTLRSLRVEQTLERPFRAAIAMTVAEPLFEPRFDGRVEVDGMDPRIFDPELPVTRATGVVNANGTGLAAFTAEGELRLATTEWGEADADFELARDGERWRFDRLTLRRPGGGPTSATLAGTLVVAKGEPLRFEGKASWEALTWPLEGGARPAVRSARGTAAGEGTVDDYTLVVDGNFAFPDVPAGRYRFTAAGDRRSLRFESLDADVLGGRVAGSGRVVWRPAVTYSFQATATGIRPHEAWPGFPAELDGGTWRLTGTGDTETMRVESLDASLLSGRVVATGNVTWEPALRYDFDATATEIRPHESWPVVPAALAGSTWHLVGAGDQQAVDLSRLHIESPTGVLEGSGRLQWEPELRWTADVRTRGMSPAVLFPEVPAQLAGGDWHLVGSGDDRRADIERISGAFLGGEVTASGDFAWEPAVSWRLTGTARGIDPAQAYPGWEGDLAVDFRTTGEQRADGPHGEVVVERTAGVLRGRALDGAGTVLLRGPDVHVDAVQARWGPGTLSLDGQIAPQLSLAFRVDDLDLDALVPEATGTLAAAGRLTGDSAAPRVDATLTGEDLAFRTYRAATLSGRAEVDLAPGGAIDPRPHRHRRRPGAAAVRHPRRGGRRHPRGAHHRHHRARPGHHPRRRGHRRAAGPAELARHLDRAHRRVA
jgi:translocation and assembly module TamB